MKVLVIEDEAAIAANRASSLPPRGLLETRCRSR